LIIKLGDRFNPLKRIVLPGLVQGCDLSIIDELGDRL
jgi:hypothetical protein